MNPEDLADKIYEYLLGREHEASTSSNKLHIWANVITELHHQKLLNSQSNATKAIRMLMNKKLLIVDDKWAIVLDPRDLVRKRNETRRISK